VERTYSVGVPEIEQMIEATEMVVAHNIAIRLLKQMIWNRQTY